ncbi:MAG: carbon-nitrogen hydrolase family protein [Thermoanaerobaculia bacterium]
MSALDSRIAIVQRAPAFLDRAECLRMAVNAVAEAAGAGARLIIFPEASIPGYPAWIWRLRPGGDMALSERLHRTLLDNAIDLEADELAPLREAAKEHRVTVVCGINERDGEFSRGTLYNTVVTLSPEGTVLNRHRKLMPTNPERMVWGQGDATGLRSVDSPCGRLGTLICWENYMPLVRYALYAQGLDVYIAPTYDNGDRWIATLQHIAREAGCWVVGSGVAFRASDIRDSAPGLRELYPDADEWVNAGDSAVVAPGGKIVAGPLRNETGILYADINTESVYNARRTLDVTGHYSRPDLFSLHVNNGASKPATFGAPRNHVTAMW